MCLFYYLFLADHMHGLDDRAFISYMNSHPETRLYMSELTKELLLCWDGGKFKGLEKSISVLGVESAHKIPLGPDR